MRKVLKWVGIALGALVALAVVVAGVLYARGASTLAKGHALPGEGFSVPTSADALARGKYLVTSAVGCTGCHGPDLGGTEFINDPMLGLLWAPNLTTGQGGVGATYADADWERSIRHGVRPNGQWLVIMPANHFTKLSDEDLGAIVAYVKTLPPVDKAIPGRRIAPVGTIMIGAGMFGKLPAQQIDQTAPHAKTMAAAVSPEYGGYLVELATCRDCHGEKLDGVASGGGPSGHPEPNLTPAGDLAHWSDADFVKTLHTGVTPDGKQLSDEMPWKLFGNMRDEDLAAIFAYLKTVPASPGAK